MKCITGWTTVGLAPTNRKTSRAVLFAVLLSAYCAMPTLASYREYGTNRVTFPQWPKGLKDLVNSPARYAGHSLNGCSEFEFHVAPTALNQFIENYASIRGFQHHIYLIPDGEPLKTDCRLELQVLDHGETTATLKVMISQTNQLNDLKVPASVTFEYMPALFPKAAASAEDTRRAGDSENEIKAFVEKHPSRSP